MHRRKHQKAKNPSESWKHLAQSEYDSKQLKNKRAGGAGEFQKSWNHSQLYEYNNMR